MGREGEKLRGKASTEAMRWADDGEGAIVRSPGDEGNDFDIRMAEEADGLLAAEKIVRVLKEKGVVLIQANAPPDLLMAACDEAEALWEEGEFKPPMRVHDDRSMLEAQLWKQALVDEDKCVWIRENEPKIRMKNALKLLSRNMGDFAGGLGQHLSQLMGIEFDRLGQAMLTCYTGDRQYNLHIDNPHGTDDGEGGLPDNGMRLSCVYFLNTHWDPAECDCCGGIDVYLTPVTGAPTSSLGARKSPKIRVAPHADTLVIFLSERMAHQVIATRGSTRWFALQLWCLNAEAMQQMTRKLLALRQPAKEDSDDD